MPGMGSHLALSIARSGGARLDGDLHAGAIGELDDVAFALSQDASQPLVLDLGGLEILDGISMVAMVNLVRRLRAGRARLTLREAPQLLAHNLYRVGMLDGPGAVALVDTRREEPDG